jgi:hypothetical protein
MKRRIKRIKRGKQWRDFRDLANGHTIPEGYAGHKTLGITYVLLIHSASLAKCPSSSPYIK